MAPDGNAEINLQPDQHTHVLFIQKDERYPTPLFYNDLKKATDFGIAVINENPRAIGVVFQIRKLLTGNFKIEQTDFNHQGGQA